MGESWKLLAFKGAAILLQCSFYDISKYQIGETVSLGRFDCLSSWRFEFSTGLFPRSSQTPRAPRGGGGGRGQLGLAPRPPTPRGPQQETRRPSPASARAGWQLGLLCGRPARLRGRGWGAGRPGALSFGRSLQADDTALPHGSPTKCRAAGTARRGAQFPGLRGRWRPGPSAGHGGSQPPAPLPLRARGRGALHTLGLPQAISAARGPGPEVWGRQRTGSSFSSLPLVLPGSTGAGGFAGPRGPILTSTLVPLLDLGPVPGSPFRPPPAPRGALAVAWGGGPRAPWGLRKGGRRLGAEARWERV